MSQTENRIPKAKLPVAFEVTMLIAQEPWFQDAMTKAEQAVAILEKHDIVGVLALSTGSLQVGLLTSVSEQKKATEEEHRNAWLTQDSVQALRASATYPYDAPDAFRKSRTGSVAPPAIDWAHAAARGVMDLLSSDRRLDQELGRLRFEHRQDLVNRAGAIIRQADAWRRIGDQR
jgi:hypothetical protein